MIFARKSSPALASLVKQLDAQLAAHEDQKLVAFVNFLGDDAAALEQQAAKLGADEAIERVALVVPADHANGPPGLEISPDAEVTVVLYRHTTVEANHAYAAGEFQASSVQQILEDLPKILKQE